MAKKILIAEDDISISEYLRMVLSKEGYQISQAYDGDEAIGKSLTEKPDLIMLEVKQPTRRNRSL